ncbi:MAG: type IX secretion system membrane protein PorP/SprF [Sphingobacteriaceae bacterium]|nr:type IX secretion system membrane protein PorP/SprF [Sphingobacteriaceae bacterium]
MIKKFILVIVLVSFRLVMVSQQDPMFTHYMFNTLWLNPAYAGTRNNLTFTGIHRSQWVSFEGAPIDQSFTLHSPIHSEKLGMGLSIINDQIGPTKSSWIALDAAYHLKLNKKAKLSVGLKGMVNIFRNNVSSLKLDVQNDQAFSNNVQSILPNAGTGIYYSTKKFYVGISSPRLIENKLGTSSAVLSKEQRHYFLITGYVLDINKSILLKQTAFVKTTFGAPVEADLTSVFIINDKLHLGLMYRTGDALGALLGIQAHKQFFIGYSFDWSFANTTGRYNSGSHEIVLRYDVIKKPEGKIKSPRYF